jgi:hypothetical protein
MNLLPVAATDAELIAFVDQWAALLEGEDYDAAHAFTDHVRSGLSPEQIRQAIKGYGQARADQHVTLLGVPSDVTQHRLVYRSEPNAAGYIAEIVYDLNIDGVATDLSATFDVVNVGDGLSVKLIDIHTL